mgnify:CR=1 FL=1
MYTQSGGMMMYTGDINYSTGLRGGVVKSVARQLLARESAFMTTYYAEKHMGIVIFSTTIPGTIQCLKLEKGSSMICQKTAFLCAEEQIMADVVFTKRLRAGLFSGEGFVLQKIYGEGRVFLEIAGDYDGFVFGTPVHWGGAGGAITSFMDRVFLCRFKRWRRQIPPETCRCGNFSKKGRNNGHMGPGK